MTGLEIRGWGENKAHCRILKQNPVFSSYAAAARGFTHESESTVFTQGRRERATPDKCTTPFVSPPLHRQLATGTIALGRALSRARKIANWAPEVGQREHEKCVKVNEIVQFGIYKCCAPFF